MDYFNYDTLGSLTELRKPDGSYNMLTIFLMIVVAYFIYMYFIKTEK